MSSFEDLYDRKYIPTGVLDDDDPPRFSQLNEVAKDAFVYEIRKYISYKTGDVNQKLTEIPNINKFAINGDNPLETMLNSILSYADTPDKFPMIAITSNTAREKNLGLGNNFVDHVAYPPSVVGSNQGPFNIQSEWKIELATRPRGTPESEVRSVIEFVDILFPDIHNATVSDIVRAIKAQALYYTPSISSNETLELFAGGPAANHFPNYIEIVGGTPECLLALGLVIGQKDDYKNPDNPPRNRYYIAADMSINVDIIADSMPIRTELSDLIQGFFTFYMEKRCFQLLGRSYFEKGLDPEEWYHIIFNNQFAWSGETNIPRQGGEQYDYIYVERGSVPITIVDYIDRKLINEPIFLERENIIPVTTLPIGDYSQLNYKFSK